MHKNEKRKLYISEKFYLNFKKGTCVLSGMWDICHYRRIGWYCKSWQNIKSMAARQRIQPANMN